MSRTLWFVAFASLLWGCGEGTDARPRSDADVKVPPAATERSALEVVVTYALPGAEASEIETRLGAQLGQLAAPADVSRVVSEFRSGEVAVSLWLAASDATAASLRARRLLSSLENAHAELRGQGRLQLGGGGGGVAILVSGRAPRPGAEELARALQMVPRVHEITVSGGAPSGPRFEVLVDEVRQRALDLDVDDLARALDGLGVARGGMPEVRDVESAVLRVVKGQTVRVRDVADVRAPAARVGALTREGPAAILRVQAAPEAHAQVRKLAEALGQAGRQVEVFRSANATRLVGKLPGGATSAAIADAARKVLERRLGALAPRVAVALEPAGGLTMWSFRDSAGLRWIDELTSGVPELSPVSFSPGARSTTAVVEIALVGDDQEALSAARRLVVERLQGFREGRLLATDDSVVPRTDVELDRAALARLGTSVDQLRAQVSWLLTGRREVAGGVLLLRREPVSGARDLGARTLALPGGRVVPLTAVARIRIASAPARLRHLDGRRATFLQLLLPEANVDGTANARVAQRLRGLELPAGVVARVLSD